MIHAEHSFNFAFPPPELCPVKKITAGILGAAAIALSVLALRQPRVAAQTAAADDALLPSGEPTPAPISLDRIRELGL